MVVTGIDYHNIQVGMSHADAQLLAILLCNWSDIQLAVQVSETANGLGYNTLGTDAIIAGLGFAANVNRTLERFRKIVKDAGEAGKQSPGEAEAPATGPIN